MTRLVLTRHFRQLKHTGNTSSRIAGNGPSLVTRWLSKTQPQEKISWVMKVGIATKVIERGSEWLKPNNYRFKLGLTN